MTGPLGVGLSSQLLAGWKGKCEQLSSFRCNKVIGTNAFYAGFQQSSGKPVLTNDWLSPRDADDHGTWCAGAAAGNPVKVKGGGQVSGMAPAARIAAYKVFWTDGNGDMYATEPDIIAAVNQGVADGVDVLSLSLGGVNPEDNYFNDLSFMRANTAGVFVAFAAGNAGPPGRGGFYRTLDNFAPFYLTVMSALMTMARVTDTSKSAIKSATGGEATPWEMGAGHVFPPAMLDPGLTYDARDRDYQNFLAGQDLNRAKKEFPGAALSPLAVRNLNLPTITLPRLQGSLQVTRTVTNVGQSRSTYSVSGKPPQGVKVTVGPRSLTLAPGEKGTYTVTVTVDTPSNDFKYGFLVWADAQGHSVRSPLVVQPISR
ncbi:unnamed protein product [Closterium sp. NIES-64]|nr:unnamed protein product [Closterium sp. NIES-64]